MTTTSQTNDRSGASASATSHLRVALCRDGAPQFDLAESEIAQAISSGSAVAWIDAQGDPARTIPQITRLVHLPDVLRESLADPIERSRMLDSAGVFAIVMHGLGFDRVAEEPIVTKLDIIFGPGFLITSHRERYEWLEQVWGEIGKATGEENAMARGLPYLLHTVIDSLVDTYFPVLDTLDDVIDELEISVVNDTSNKVQQRLFHLKRAVATLRRVTLPQAEVMSSITMRTGALIPADAEPYFADVRDHTVRVYEMLDSYRDLLSGLLDVYLSTVSNRLNSVMKQLAIIATIFMPITFVTGVFGQNFGSMPQVLSDHGFNFWYVLAFMALVSVTQIWYFRRRGWL
ncbi:MAG TPA: magnesium transporter CorA family protein [Ktedonobacterales bacterium]